MPYIKFESGKLSKEVKEELIDKLTKISSEITGISKEFFFISIDEKKDTDLAVGGKTVKQIKNELSK